MKTFKAKHDELFDSIKRQLGRLIEKYGEPSEHVVDSKCIRIGLNDFKEITAVFNNQDNIVLVDSNGYHYGLNCIELDALCFLVDELIEINN